MHILQMVSGASSGRPFLSKFRWAVLLGLGDRLLGQSFTEAHVCGASAGILYSYVLLPGEAMWMVLGSVFWGRKGTA